RSARGDRCGPEDSRVPRPHQRPARLRGCADPAGEEDSMLTELASVLGGLVTGVGGVCAAGLLSRRKRRADAVQVLTQAAAQMVEPLSRQIAAMTAELEAHRRVVADSEQRCR